MTEPVAPAETPTAPTAKPDVAKGSRGRRWAIGLSLFTLLTLAGLTATGYWLGWPWVQAQWQRFEDLERQLADAQAAPTEPMPDVTALARAAADQRIEAGLASVEADWQRELSALRARQNAERAESVRQLSGRMGRVEDQMDRLLAVDRRAWLGQEAVFLTRLAGQRLLVARDVDAALALLEQADVLLRDTGEPKFEGATLQEFDVQDREKCLAGELFPKGSVDAVVCCLASRTGTKKDSYAIDYQASLNCAEAAKAAGARRFILLSAYCVKSAERGDPYALQFQYAKKELEEKLAEMADDSFDYVSVRPTAFFKSVSGQVEVVDGGGPFVYFDLGNDVNAICNPISEPDLAAALIDEVADDAHKNTYWNLGGPDEGLSMKQQGALIHEVLKKEGEPKYISVPIGLFDVIINGLQWIGDTFNSEKFDDAAEL